MKKKWRKFSIFGIIFFIFSLTVGRYFMEYKNVQFSDFSKEVNVFGVKILATDEVTDEKLMHAGKVLAQYLDNDEDGNADNSLVVKQLNKQNATLLMFKDNQEVRRFRFGSLPT